MIDAARRLGAAFTATPYASRLGLEAGEVMGDVVTASVPYAPLLANAQGFVHGGVAASLGMWTAMMVAVASERGQARAARPISFSLNYLAAAREEALHATARVSARGRDIVHVEMAVDSERGRPVAMGLAVLRTVPEEPRQARSSPSVTGGEAASVREDQRLISPFSQAMGIALRPEDAAAVGATTALAMRRDLNEGFGGGIDPGALVALADTCAALACMPSLDERLSGSATLSLAAVFGNPLFAPALAIGRPVAEDAGVRSALIEIHRDQQGGAPRRPAMTACVSYRFRAAEESS